MISNGFDTEKVLTALKGRIGWRQPAGTGQSYSVSHTRKDESYIVGTGSPAPNDGDTELIDASLKGYDYTVEIRGTGTMMEDAEITIKQSGGFSLNQGQFYDDQVIIIHFKPVTTVLQEGPGDLPDLTEENKASASGRYYQDFHAAVTIDNLYATMDQLFANEVDFNTYLDQLEDSVIIEALNAVFSVPELIESRMLFNCGAYSPRIVPNESKFVGFRIRVAPGAFAVKISTVTLFLTEGKTFNLYLYNEHRKAPIWTKEVTVNEDDETIIELDDCFLRHSGPDNKGGIFYLGYFQDDLGTAQAVEQDFYPYIPGKIFGACSMEAPVSAGMFDKSNVGQSYRSYGLNLEINVFRDHTRQIIQNAYLFDELIGLYMASKVMEGTVYSTRTNATERINKENVGQVYADLNQAIPTEEVPIGPGIKTRITREIKRVHASFFPKDVAQIQTIGCRS